MNVLKHSDSAKACRFKGQALRLSASLIAIGGFVVASLPGSPAIAIDDSQGDFNRCASTLIGLSLSPEDVIDACSRTLNPEALEECVSRVSSRGYAAMDALNACRQVRRPKDMAFCVTNIQTRLQDAVATDVLDNCRRSLLPIRYANCVTGIAQGTTDVASSSVLNSCNDGGYFPREVDPTFIPYSANEPSLLVPDATQTTPFPDVTVPTPQPVAPTPTPAPAPVRGLY